MKKAELRRIIDNIDFGILDPEVDVDKVILNSIINTESIIDFRIFMRFAILQLRQTLEATEHLDNEESLID